MHLQFEDASYTVPFLDPELQFDNKTYDKAMLLIGVSKHLPCLSNTKRFKIRQRITSGNDGGVGGDSDDEVVPTPRVEPSFSECNLRVVQFCFDELKRAYIAARAVGFVNCCGKTFFQELCKYANCCSFNEREHEPEYRHLLNTATGGAQPGAFYIKWVTPSRPTRNQKEDIESIKERYADAVSYNTSTHINDVVSEIKQDDDRNAASTSAKAQHNEQMIGLWQPKQLVMLGFEFYTDFVVPKVLLLKANDLMLFYLERLDLTNTSDMGTLTKLVITFLSYVQMTTTTMTSSRHHSHVDREIRKSRSQQHRSNSNPQQISSPKLVQITTKPDTTTMDTTLELDQNSLVFICTDYFVALVL